VDEKSLHKIARRVASGRIRTAGMIEFKKDQGPIRRDLRSPGFEWTDNALRDLAKVLWASQRAHSYALSAYQTFSKMQSAQFSPDGLLGGRGYIQSIKDMRSSMAQAVEVFSSFTDTIQDEINADHWSKSGREDEETSELIDNAEEIKKDPETFVESEYVDSVTSEPGENDNYFESGEYEEEPVENPDADDLNPELADSDDSDDDDDDNNDDDLPEIEGFHTSSSLRDRYDYGEESPKASLPNDETDQSYGQTESELLMHTTTPDRGNIAGINRLIRRHMANSSVDPNTLPGPRVEHLGPASSESGVWADGDPYGSDDPMGNNLFSGTDDTNPLYEDYCADGVSAYDTPTDGDSSIFKKASYSNLPGADNKKILPIYDLGLSSQDVDLILADHDEADDAGEHKDMKPYNWDLE